MRYLICTTPRTGSSLLASVLEQTDLAGLPREYFLPQLCPATYPEIVEYARSLVQEKTTNGYYGCKIMWAHFEKILLAGLLSGSNEAEIFLHDKYIWLVRRNKLFQAISHVRARITDQWSCYVHEAMPVPITYTEQEEQFILWKYNVFLQQEAQWRMYFLRNKIEPLKIFYEDLQSDLEGEVRKVLSFLEVTQSITQIPTPKFKKQSLETDTLQVVEKLYKKHPKLFETISAEPT